MTCDHAPDTVAWLTDVYATSTITLRSVTRVRCGRARSQGPSQRCTSCPAANGRSSCSRIPARFPPACPEVRTISTPTSSGVSTMPTTLEIVAPVIAPATFPRATEVNTTDACTVDGQQRQVQQPGLELGRDDGVRQQLDQQAEHGERHVGGREHRPLQPPAAQARPHLAGRHARAVEEEQEHDRGRAGDVEDVGDDPARRQQEPQQERRQDHHDERVDPAQSQSQRLRLASSSGTAEGTATFCHRAQRADPSDPP